MWCPKAKNASSFPHFGAMRDCDCHLEEDDLVRKEKRVLFVRYGEILRNWRVSLSNDWMLAMPFTKMEVKDYFED